ncbi:Protein of unknown function [Cotesia congregata]|uniref:Uncharacterized protein n=1 Tax=Cotesia congregata TaxID=51543 RepID=A0A8J2H511_COTCN|nr:Protein of unknown function [Cotesia congregata]
MTLKLEDVSCNHVVNFIEDMGQVIVTSIPRNPIFFEVDIITIWRLIAISREPVVHSIPVDPRKNIISMSSSAFFFTSLEVILYMMSAISCDNFRIFVEFTIRIFVSVQINKSDVLMETAST